MFSEVYIRVLSVEMDQGEDSDGPDGRTHPVLDTVKSQ
jgi:hypothetical protein